MKIVAISDNHGNLVNHIPKCDLLTISGDICPSNHHYVEFQKSWLSTNFIEWLKGLEQCKNIVFIAGNHDWFFEKGTKYQILEFIEKLPKNCHYLMDEAITINDLVIYGTPWQPVFCQWAFNLTEPQLAKKFEKIPEVVDILLAHGPPHGFGDTIMEYGETDHLGSRSLISAISSRKVKFCFFGHIHSGDHDIIESNGTKFANVSLLDEKYDVFYPPLEITYPSEI